MASKNTSLMGAALITHNLKAYGGGSMAKGLERFADENKKAGIREERSRNATLISWLANNVFKAKR